MAQEQVRSTRADAEAPTWTWETGQRPDRLQGKLKKLSTGGSSPCRSSRQFGANDE